MKPESMRSVLRTGALAVRRSYVLLMVCAVAGLASGILVTLTTPKVYLADARIFVAASIDATAELRAGSDFTLARVKSYASLVESPEVVDHVIRTLGLKISRTQLGAEIQASAQTGKTVIDVDVLDQDPQLAARIANTAAGHLQTVVDRVEAVRTDGSRVVKLTLTNPARVPTTPVVPRWRTNVVLGLVVGLLVGAGTSTLRRSLDQTVRGPGDLEASQLPVLAVLARSSRPAGSPIVFRDRPRGDRAEAYRQLRSNLQFANVDRPPRVIAVTSALPDTGTAMVAANLAAAIAETGARVCLLEANLRRPTTARTLGLRQAVGLTTLLAGHATTADVEQYTRDRFSIIASGEVPPNPSQLLQSTRAKTVIASIAAAVDYTVIYAAPLVSGPDGVSAAVLADLTLLVVPAGKTTSDDLARAHDMLARVSCRPVAIVLDLEGDRDRSGRSDRGAEVSRSWGQRFAAS